MSIEQHPALVTALAVSARAFSVSAAAISGGPSCMRANWARQTAFWLAARHGIPQRAIAAATGRSVNCVCTSVRSVDDRISIPRWDAHWCACHAAAVAAFDAQHDIAATARNAR